jgi:hypothetical protein
MRTLAKALNSGKGLRKRIADVEICGSVENKLALAQECIQQKMLSEAVALLRDCLTGIYGDDAGIRFGLASTLLLSGCVGEPAVFWRISNQDCPRSIPALLLKVKQFEQGISFEGASFPSSIAFAYW